MSRGSHKLCGSLQIWQVQMGADSRVDSEELVQVIELCTTNLQDLLHENICDSENRTKNLGTRLVVLVQNVHDHQFNVACGEVSAA